MIQIHNTVFREEVVDKFEYNINIKKLYDKNNNLYNNAHFAGNKILHSFK
jgi:hypothetical protein